MSKLYWKLRPHLDAGVNWLALSGSPAAESMVKILKVLAPGIAARILFRRGELRTALQLTSSRTHQTFATRLKDMVVRLDQPIAPVESVRRMGQFNSKVLQVLHSSSTFDLNGYAVRSEQLISSLHRKSIEVFAMTRLGYPWDLPHHANLPAFENSASGNSAYTHTPDLQRGIGGVESEYFERYSTIIKDTALTKGCRVLHAHSNYINGMATAQAARELGLPCIYEMRGLWHETRAVNDPAYLDSEHFLYTEKMELTAASHANHVVTISTPLAEWLVARGISQDSISVIGNAAEEPDKNSERTQPTNMVIGYIGSVVRYEGLDTLIMAMPRVLREAPEARLHIIGEGSHLPDLRDLVENLGLTNRVFFHGRLTPEEARGRYQQFTMAVLPRKSNRVTELVPPLKPMEIMAAGTPLISSDVAPLREIVADSENGLIFSAGDADALAVCMLNLYRDIPMQNRLIAGGKSWARAHSWDNNATKYTDLYHSLYR